MPVITFTDKDMKRGTIVQPAWYRVKIDFVGEAELASSQKTYNYPIEATIIKNADNGDKAFEGVPINFMFNSGAIGLAKDFCTALGGDIKAGARFELKAAEGKELDMFIANGTYNGRAKNDVPHQYRAAKNG
jgi:hypothetical protein